MKDLPPDTLREVLNRIGAGDDKAVNQLFLHYHAAVFRFISLRNVPTADAEELAQDVLLSVLTKPSAFEGRSQFSTWLFSIAKNRAADYHRSHARIPEVPMDERAQDAADKLADPMADVLQMLEAAQDREAMLVCIRKLPDDLKETVMLVIFDMDTLAEAAAALQCPPGTVKSRMFHARNRLSDCIQRWLNGGRHGK